MQGAGFGSVKEKKNQTNESTPNLRLGFGLRKNQDRSVLGDSDGLGQMDQMQEGNADSLIQPSPDLMGRVAGNNTH